MTARRRIRVEPPANTRGAVAGRLPVNRAALPRPSLCLNVPKTGTQFMNRFLDAADWLHLKRACGLRRLRPPGGAAIRLVRRIKRHGIEFGNLNSRLHHYHAGYSSCPAGLRRHPKLCALRGVQGWYCSFHLYHTLKMKNTLLSRAIRVLAEGGHERDPDVHALLLRHRGAFLERFEGEDATSRSIENVSAAFLVWYMQTLRLPNMVRIWLGAGVRPPPVGFLTFRAIAVLFENPKGVFGLPAEEFEDYFSSGRYRRDLRCDHILRTETLTGDLCAAMKGPLGYAPDIVEHLRSHASRRNASPEAARTRVLRELEADGLLGRIRRRERIYERYLLPLAGRR